MAATILAVAAIGSGATAPPSSASRSTAPASYPAAGPLLVPKVVARVAPDPHARAVAVLHMLRRDYRPTIILALKATTGTDRQRWLRIELAGRPNGRLGWIPAADATLQSTRVRIVVDLSARTVSLLHRRKVLLRTRAAVGRPQMPTPLGSFYIAAKFKPTNDPVLGAYAMETSAYSSLSEWPGGGIVGIHGTNTPKLLGQAVSHGCVRVSNRAILRLARLAPLGTPISIIR